MKKLFLISIFIFCLVKPFFASPKDSIAIMKVMNDQLFAWNSGSIEGFMKGYWKSDELKFITKKGVNYGWQAVTDNYKKSFPSKDAMGNLVFKTDHVHQISSGLYLVTGTWLVESKDGNKSGYYSLLFKKINGDWFIIVDHTF